MMDKVRYARAQELLKQEGIKLIDIALQLGYEHASSFTRSFRRWTGVTPREYRNFHVDFR
ncbi:MAG: helix-turn-helix domain-containing protein [Gammaproteobacteria bacterium]|nr:helix-turn-helix domain-containing protein [Gammaproteobacteria bacterium]